MSSCDAGLRIGRGILLGTSPALLALFAGFVGSLGGFLLLPAGVLLIAVSFRGAFIVADEVTTATWKNLALGFALTAIFLVGNVVLFGTLLEFVGSDD